MAATASPAVLVVPAAPVFDVAALEVP